MIKGFDSWNVPLGQSLDSMPPKRHVSGLRENSSNQVINSLKALENSDFVLSTCAQDASFNIWSTKAGLILMAAYSFKVLKFLDPKDN